MLHGVLPGLFLARGAPHLQGLFSNAPGGALSNIRHDNSPRVRSERPGHGENAPRGAYCNLFFQTPRALRYPTNFNSVHQRYKEFTASVAPPFPPTSGALVQATTVVTKYNSNSNNDIVINII